MLIDREKCIGCGKCVPYCPMGAIIFHKKDKEKGLSLGADEYIIKPFDPEDMQDKVKEILKGN